MLVIVFLNVESEKNVLFQKSIKILKTMQEAGIANPNRGLIGKNFLGSGKEYRNHKVPNSIPEIEMRDRIYYNIAPNSLIEVYKEDQAMYNKSFNGPLSQVMSQRSDVIQAANMDSEIEGT